MSWHTPLRTAQASAAVECTPVTPCMYSIASPMAVAISIAASQGLVWRSAMSCAIFATSSGGWVRRVCLVCSMFSVDFSTVTASASHARSCRSCSRGRTSTRLVAVNDNSLWGVRISNDETRDPQ